MLKCSLLRPVLEGSSGSLAAVPCTSDDSVCSCNTSLLAPMLRLRLPEPLTSEDCSGTRLNPGQLRKSVLSSRNRLIPLCRRVASCCGAGDVRGRRLLRAAAVAVSAAFDWGSDDDGCSRRPQAAGPFQSRGAVLRAGGRRRLPGHLPSQCGMLFVHPGAPQGAASPAVSRGRRRQRCGGRARQCRSVRCRHPPSRCTAPCPALTQHTGLDWCHLGAASQNGCFT